MRFREPSRALGWRAPGFVTVLVAGLVLLAGCTGGSPGLVEDARPTATAQQIAAASNLSVADVGGGQAATDQQSQPTVTATATASATATRVDSPTATATTEPTPRPTRTPKPKPSATARPEAPTAEDPSVGVVVEQGTSGRPEIALTFDAGADRGNAEQILDILDQYGIKASFGITGHWAKENPDLVKRMVKEGHMVFNHTWSHHSFLADSPSDPETIPDTETRLKELDDTADEISKLTHGYDVRPYWRPPYGEYDDSVLQDVASDGYTVTVMWTCDTLGWNGASVEEIVDRCGSDPQPGDIILMHVGADSLDADALSQLIETLQAQGYDLVTVEQLLQP